MSEPDSDRAPDSDPSDETCVSEDGGETLITSDASVRVGGAPTAGIPRRQTLITEPVDVPAGVVLEGRARYHCVRCIGRGGMGSVFLAEVERADDTSGDLPETVAVKIMPGSDGSSGAVPRAEIGVMKALRHPNVVRLYDWSFAETMSFAVMDVHRKGSLLDMIRSRGRLPAAAGQRLLIDILSALVEAHGRGILHLDIKPANVLIGDDDRFLLTDFGISGTLFQDRARRIVGTPAFMSPEQASGEMSTLDARSDLFMLGATVWQALTADFSIQRRAPTLLLRERKKSTLEKLVPRVAESLAPLARIVDDLLEFEAHRRPGTAAEVLHRVRQLRLDATDSDVASVKPATGTLLSAERAAKIQRDLTDPLLRDLLDMEGTFFELRYYDHGEIICSEGEHTYDVYILLAGKVDVLRRGEIVFEQPDEGATMGEVAALVGSPRPATLRANGSTALAVFKGAELEQAARKMPALAVRLMKNLASIVADHER